MQEEVEQRTVALTVNTFKLTGRVLKAAISKYLHYRKEKARDGPVKPCGKLGAPMTAEKTPLTRLDIRMVPCRLSFEAFRHLRRLDGSSLTDHTVEYEVDIPENAETLCVRVYGNVAVAYSMDCEPVLLNDHFCDGDVWCIDVRGVRTARIKVQPLAEEDRGTIYFECNMPAGVIPPEVWASDCAPVL